MLWDNQKFLLLSSISCLLLLLSCGAAPGVTTEVPADMSAKISLKVFKFDQSLRKIKRPAILIYFANSSDKNEEETARNYGDIYGSEKFETSTVSSTNELKKSISNANIVVNLTGDTLPVSERRIIDNNVLTFSINPAHIENGLASVGIRLHKEKPQLLFNLPRLNTEGHNIPSQVLKLGKVYRQN